MNERELQTAANELLRQLDRQVFGGSLDSEKRSLAVGFVEDFIKETWQARAEAGAERIASLMQPLKDACDRDWKDETPEQIAVIAANAIYWRGRACQSPETLAQVFHETYERLAPNFGYETREESAKPWSDVPDKNKRLMIAVCAELLATGPQPPAQEVKK